MWCLKGDSHGELKPKYSEPAEEKQNDKQVRRSCIQKCAPERHDPNA